MAPYYFKQFVLVKLFFLFVGIFMSSTVWATHNRAGEITVEQIGDCNSLTVKATIVTYTKTSSRPVDRDSLTICWGDGMCETLARVNGRGNGEPLENDVKKNIYTGEHIYPGRGTYEITMTDPNRNGGILNVNFPNSDQIPFHLSTIYTFLNPQFQGCNSTPFLLQPPIDIGCVGQPFIHNPNAYDLDGDSLSYHLIVPFQDIDVPVINYFFPDQIAPGPENKLTIDEVTGDILWDAPQQRGEYNLALIIVEHRNGIPIDTMVRDMQITIEGGQCQENEPPEIELPFEEVCVIAGETLSFDVIATAPISETQQKVKLTALGGPFEVDVLQATFEVAGGYQPQPLVGRFVWQTSCEDIADQAYSVVFKAVDDEFLDDTTGLSTLKTLKIKVVGPPPEDLQAEAEQGVTTITWEQPYDCEMTEREYFQGFSVWRRENTNQFELDTCQPGLAGQGYQKIAFNQRELNSDNRYFYEDITVERGRTYCYRVLGEFAKRSPSGNYTYNRVESLASDEICVQLSRDIPLLTKASVEATSTTDGTVLVHWTKPNVADLDTIQNPGPYRYELWRAIEDSPDFVPIYEVSYNSILEANDTTFLDMDLNTANQFYAYQLAFYVAGETEPLGTSPMASTVFLTISPTDRANSLSWTETVPWDNIDYVIHRKNNTTGLFEAIDTTSEPVYLDRNLDNQIEYCYKIESIGSYGIDGVLNPLLNYSQEACAVPMDNVPPCPPVLTVSNLCNEATSNIPLGVFFNELSWENMSNEDCNPEEVAAYTIYYASQEGENLALIRTINNPDDTTFEDQPSEFSIAGCYAVATLDTLGNESEWSNIVCVDNCPDYELPNTFTPNGDNNNDLFVPRYARFIAQVDFQVYNRWGQLVFETQDPLINWDGSNMQGDKLADGVYYYTCVVYEQTLSGVEQQAEPLSGYIQLISGQ